MSERVDVIVRTHGGRARLGLLSRAIASVARQRGADARPVVIVAGDGAHGAAEIAAQYSAKVYVAGRAISPGCAVKVGRDVVDAPFYAFLDDDDELFPDAIATRLAAIQHLAADVVVTSGYWVSGEQRRIHIADLARHQHDCLNGIIERCWLASCAGLFRTATIAKRYFEDLPDLCEWTSLAFRLSVSGVEVRFLDVPTYNCYDTPGSASKGEDFLKATIGVLESMRASALPRAERVNLERRYRSTLHDAADHYRKKKDLAKAWGYHLRSMKPPYAFRYGAYTRKLLWNGGAGGIDAQGPSPIDTTTTS